MVQVALERQVLEVGVGHDQRQRGRALVDLPALDADPAVLHHVEPPEAAAARQRAQVGDQVVGAERRAVEADRDARLEADDDLDRLGLGDPGQRVDVVGRGRPRVLDGAALDRLAPQVVVDGVQLLLGDRDGDLPLGRQLDAVLAGQAPDPGRARRCRGRGRGRARPPRSAPGRCPCPCSRGPPPSPRGGGPRRRGGARSPGATARRRAGTCPRSGRWPAGPARRTARPSRGGRRRRRPRPPRRRAPGPGWRPSPRRRGPPPGRRRPPPRRPRRPRSR